MSFTLSRSFLFLSTGLLATSILFSSCETEQEAPATITTDFSQRYAAAADVEWEQENEQEWEAEFEMDGITYSATYNATGEWQETEHEIALKDVPAAVTAAVRNSMGEVKVGEIEWVESAAYGTAYELEVEGDNEAWELLIDSQGNIIKKIATDDDKEETE